MGRRAYSTVSLVSDKKRKYISVWMWDGQLEYLFDYKTLDLKMIDDLHTGEWVTLESKEDLAWAKKNYYKTTYEYARRKAREYKNAKKRK